MKTVKEIMYRAPKYCTEKETLLNAVKELSRASIGSLPVVDSNKKVVGIITTRDICNTLGRTSKALTEIKVEDAMNYEAHFCHPEDDTQTVLKIMRTKKVHRLPVVDKEGHLKGLLSLNGIVRELAGKERAEIEYAGAENIVKTLRAIAEKKHEHAEALVL
ncbi:MAG TPA: CBS domain-containing protein [Bacteroidia bacterium]|jgi:IMP dehydrogenase|nr:CBS domain-containing protein [Bacteroidia bacterium]